MTDQQATLFGGIDTLQAARERVFRQLPIGGACPCCDQLAKEYRRRIVSAAAASLIWMVFETKGDEDAWVDMASRAPGWAIRNREFSRLAVWDLVRQQPNRDDPERKTSGLWQPTGRGVSFVNGMRDVPKYVYLYNGRPRRWSDERVNIVQSLEGGGFKYDELMRGDRYEEDADGR